MQPGEVGLAFIYFDGSSELPPTDAEYEFTVNTSAADQAFYNTAPLKVTEASASGDAIVGAAVNGTGESVGGPFSVSVYCFDGDKLLSRRIRSAGWSHRSGRAGHFLGRPLLCSLPDLRRRRGRVLRRVRMSMRRYITPLHSHLLDGRAAVVR